MTLQRLAFACLLFSSLTAFGQTRYISDDIPITLRSGPSLENRIVRNLSSGVRVEALEVDEENGYTRVRVAGDGTEGWVLSRYLSAEPVARERLGAAERELAAARERVAELEAQVDALTDDLALTRGELDTAASTSTRVSSELEEIRRASANAVALRDQNEELRNRLADSEERVGRLTMENTALASDSRQNWFIVGAGVLFGGILIGLVAPHFKRKRRSDW